MCAEVVIVNIERMHQYHGSLLYSGLLVDSPFNIVITLEGMRNGLSFGAKFAINKYDINLNEFYHRTQCLEIL